MAPHPNLFIMHWGRLNARVMETAGKAFYGVWNMRVNHQDWKRRVMETACKQRSIESAWSNFVPNLVLLSKNAQ